jgi:hypothetical protein
MNVLACERRSLIAEKTVHSQELGASLSKSASLGCARRKPMRASMNPPRWARVMITLASPILLSSSCGASHPPAPSSTPGDGTGEPAAPSAQSSAAPAIPSEPVASGKDCAKATARCGGGACAVTIDNKCPDPVHCESHVVDIASSQ